MYQIKELAEMANVSKRTLRHYEAIGLLVPSRRNQAGYRLYGEEEVDRLQQILLYRELGLALATIKEVLSSADYDAEEALRVHKERLMERRHEIDRLIDTVEKTLSYQKGEIKMTDREKFEGFKKEAVTKNEALYGEEIRAAYGEELVEESKKKWMNLSESEYTSMVETEKTLLSLLDESLKKGPLEERDAEELADLHKRWLSYSWPKYSKKAHQGLVTMYLADERFIAYYDELVGPGATERLVEAVMKGLK